MPASGGENPVCLLAKTKVPLHSGGWTLFHIWAKPAGSLPPRHPCTAAGHMPCFTCGQIPPCSRVGKAQRGRRLLNCGYFLPLRSTLCWKLCFCKQAWGLFHCIFDAFGRSAGHPVGFFTVVYNYVMLLSRESGMLLRLVLYWHAEVIAALRDL